MKQRNLISLINDIISESVLPPSLKYLNFSSKEIAKFNNKDKINIIRRKSDVSDIFVGDYIKPEWNKIYVVVSINQFSDVSDCPSFQFLSESEMMEFIKAYGELIERYMPNKPGEGRKVRKVTFVVSPNE